MTKLVNIFTLHTVCFAGLVMKWFIYQTFGLKYPILEHRVTQVHIYSRKNGPKRFLGTTHVRRLIRKCVTIAIFAKKTGHY